MKSSIKPAVLVILSGLLMLFGVPHIAGFAQERHEIKRTPLPRAQDTTKIPESVQKETYVSKVILQAPWGKKNLVYDNEESTPGEFGLHAMVISDSLREELPAPPLPEGPTSFTVAPNGDIYITDPLNERIQRFDANGNLISVIPIPHFDGSKYVNSYAQEWTLICADLRNNVYLLWWEDDTEQYLCKYDPTGKLLNTYPFFPEVRTGGAGNKLFCYSFDTLFFEYWRKDTDKIMLSQKEELLLKKPFSLFRFQIGTADKVFSSEEQKITLIKVAIRETPNLIKIKEQAYKKLPGVFWGPENIWNYEFVDEKGNFYHYWSTKEGITITKWYKQ